MHKQVVINTLPKIYCTKMACDAKITIPSQEYKNKNNTTTDNRFYDFDMSMCLVLLASGDRQLSEDVGQ